MTTPVHDVSNLIADAVGFPPRGGYASEFPAVGDVRVKPSLDGRRLDIAYVAVDPLAPVSFWSDDGAKGNFRKTAGAARERHIRRLVRDQAVAFDVIQGAEGNLCPVLVASVDNPIGVYALPQHIANQVHAGELDVSGAYDIAAEILDGYSSWCRGELCGVVIERFSIDVRNGQLIYIDTETHWIQTGPIMAEKRLEELMAPEMVMEQSFSI